MRLYFFYCGKALIGLGGCRIGSFESSKTQNAIEKDMSKTDMGREGSVSKGKQPRVPAKTLN